MRASPIIVVALFIAACPDKPTSGLPDAEPFMGEDLPTCTPECSGRTCGPDPMCGRSCGSCDSDEMCSAAGACVQNCTPGCGARQCGVDDCGASCGSCGTGSTCDEMTGACVETALRIEGVTIPNASVAVTVSSSQFSTTADAMGVYAIELGMQDASNVVIVRACGIGADDFVELASIAGDIESLTTNAGADHVVTAAEDHGLVVNPISTAEYAAFFAVNGGRAPATRAELDAAEEDLDEALTGRESFQVACAIRLLIDRTGTMLPASHQTTLELAEDLPALWAFVNPLTAVLSLFDTVLDAPAEELRLDPSTSVDIASFAPGLRLQDLLKSRNGLPGGAGGHLDFQNGGQGSEQRPWTTYGRPVPVLNDFTWSIDGNTLKTEYAPQVDSLTYFLSAEDIVARLGDPSLLQAITNALEPNGGGVDVSASILGEERIFTARGKKIETAIVRQEFRWRFDRALLPFGITVPAVNVFEPAFGEHLRSEASLARVPFQRDEIIGTWTMRLVVPADAVSYFDDRYLLGEPILVSALINFREDGTATALYGITRAAIDLTWSLDGDGRLTIALPSGETQTYEKLTEGGGLAGVLTTYLPSGGAALTDYGRDAKADDMLVFTADMLASNAGEYWQTTISNYLHVLPGGGFPPEYVFGWIFDGGEVATRLVGDAFGGPTTREENWNWREHDGVVEVEQRTDQNHNMRCTYDDPSCIALRRRTWTPLALGNGNFVVLEFESYLRERTLVRSGRFVWEPMRGVWMDPITGNIADSEDRLYGIEPRANAYVTAPIPPN